MSIEWFRDLVISIWGLVAIGVLIFVAILSYSLYRRARPILDSIKTTSSTIEGISSHVRDGVARPLAEVAAIVQGVSYGIDAVTKLFRKQKGGNDV
jgi:hypothetical protein